MIRALILASVLSAVASGALAQEVIATAAVDPAGGLPGPVTPAAGVLRLSDHVDGADNIVRSGPCGGPAIKPDGTPDRSAHGEVSVGAGTHGYRQAGGVVCVPLGDHAAATIAVDTEQINGRSGWRR
jgi:hypothetical protein